MHTYKRLIKCFFKGPLNAALSQPGSEGKPQKP